MPACVEQDIVVSTSVQGMCINYVCIVCPSGFVWAITYTFMDVFQNNLAHLFSLRRICVD